MLQREMEVVTRTMAHLVTLVCTLLGGEGLLVGTARGVAY